MGDPTRGLYGKFFVERTDGKSEPGQKHHGCEYFILDLHHDKHAISALRAYALSCRHEYPLLADDLIDKVTEMEHRFLPGASSDGRAEVRQCGGCGAQAGQYHATGCGREGVFNG